MPVAVPPGWPAGLPPPDAPDWQRTAVGWLLDLCPGEYRGYEVLRRHPVVLARLTSWQVAGALAATQDGLADVRRDLRDTVPADVVAATVAVLEREVERLTRLTTAVDVVGQALAGVRFVPRL